MYFSGRASIEERTREYYHYVVLRDENMLSIELKNHQILRRLTGFSMSLNLILDGLDSVG